MVYMWKRHHLYFFNRKFKTKHILNIFDSLSSLAEERLSKCTKFTCLDSGRAVAGLDFTLWAVSKELPPCVSSGQHKVRKWQQGIGVAVMLCSTLFQTCFFIMIFNIYILIHISIKLVGLERVFSAIKSGFLANKSNHIILSVSVALSSPGSGWVITKHHHSRQKQDGLSEAICSVYFMVVTSVLIKQLLLLIVQYTSHFPMVL